MNKALVAIVLILMGCFVGCGPQYNTLYLRDDLQTFCRENDAVVLASSYFLPTGKIYYFEKQDGQWRKSQVLDLVPYLKEDFSNWHTVHINDDCKRNDDYKKNWLVYNDRWLVVTIRKSSAGNVNDTMRDYRGKAIIFKKIDSVWKHYYTLTSKEFFVYAKCVALTDFDQLIVSDPFKRTGEFKGIVRCFDLTGNKPRLVQELRPLESNCTTNERTGDYFPTPRFGKDFYVNKNVLIIGNGKDVPSNSINPQVNYLLYFPSFFKSQTRKKRGCRKFRLINRG